MTYTEILKKILEAVAANPDANIDDVLADAARDMGLGEDKVKEVRETNSMIDRFARKTDEIAQARSRGISREVFVSDEINRISAGLDEQDQEVLSKEIQSLSKESETK